jgi:hypothetical protein
MRRRAAHLTVAAFAGVVLLALGGPMHLVHAAGMAEHSLEDSAACPTYYSDSNYVTYGSGRLNATLVAEVPCGSATVTFSISYATSNGDLLDNGASSITIHSIIYGAYSSGCTKNDFYLTGAPGPAGDLDYGYFPPPPYYGIQYYYSAVGCQGPAAGDSGSFFKDDAGTKHTFPYLYISLPSA